MSVSDTLMDKLLDSKHFKDWQEKDEFTDEVVSCLSTSAKVLSVLNKINYPDERVWRIQASLMKNIRAFFDFGLLSDLMPPHLLENHHAVCLDIVKQTCPLPDRTPDFSYMRPNTAAKSWWRRKIWALRHLLSFVRVSSLGIELGENPCPIRDDVLDYCRDVLETYRPDQNTNTDIERTIPYYSQMLQFVEVSPRFERSFEVKLFRLLCRYGPDENLLQESPVYEQRYSENHYIDHNLLRARIEFNDARATSRHALRNLYSQPLINHVKQNPDKLHPILNHFFETIFKQDDDIKIEVVLGVLSLTFARLTPQERIDFNFPLKYIDHNILTMFEHKTKYLRARAMRMMTYWIDIVRTEARDANLVKKTIKLLLKALVTENDVTTRIETVTCLYNFRLNQQLAVDLAIDSADKRAICLELCRTFRLAPINTNVTILLQAIIRMHRDDLVPVYGEMMAIIDTAIREIVQVNVKMNERKDLIILAMTFYAIMIENNPDKRSLVEAEARIIDTVLMVFKQYDYRLCSNATLIQEKLNERVITRTSRRTFNFVQKLLREPDHYFTNKPAHQSPDELKRFKHVIKMIRKNENQELAAASPR